MAYVKIVTKRGGWDDGSDLWIRGEIRFKLLWSDSKVWNFRSVRIIPWTR